MNDKKNISLRYPLEMYYPSDNELNNEEKYDIITRFKNYILTTDKKINPLSNDKEVILLNSFLENDKLYDYFYGVRKILELLISGRDPEILFEQLFPSDEEDISVFKNQFSDACDIILIREEIDWSRMKLDWYNFKKNNGYIK